MIGAIRKVCNGNALTLTESNVQCSGGGLYTAFRPMPELVPLFVSEAEHYKRTPEMVRDYIAIFKRNLNNEFYSRNVMLDNIRDAWLIKGTQPTRRDMDNAVLSRISSGTYLRNLGSWYNALDAFVQYISNNDSNADDIIPLGEDKHLTKREPNNRLKAQVLMRDGNRCRLCGVECNDGLHNIHFDHIILWSKGGETTLDNLQVLCSDCNLAKGNIE